MAEEARSAQLREASADPPEATNEPPALCSECGEPVKGAAAHAVCYAPGRRDTLQPR